MPTSKVPISLLPLPPATHILTHNLTPDHHIPSVSAFRNEVLLHKPSIQRRARLLAPQSHFSYVSPFPLPFPYEITAPDPPQPYEDKGQYVEQWLSSREAVHEATLILAASDGPTSDLTKYYPHNRDQPRVLIGLAESGLKDCLPRLDVGDALDILGTPTLVPPSVEDSKADSRSASTARQELIDVLSGHVTLMSPESKDGGDGISFAPWSLRYSGHQFGSWAGQLGDGRAISVLVTPHPSDANLTYELQLKGSGRTPFSRSADGLAVLRSSIREFLCSEAMHALSIPTTRSLSLVSLPELPVARERLEYGCVLTRVAPSFLRIGSLEALHPPASMFFFGGGQQEAHWDALRILGEWCSQRVLKLDIAEGKAWGKELVMEVTRRNAKMVAGWQAYGFMHGVINTDNVSLLGLTIDYGPYAFMDVFDPYHICNHSDGEGRYAYKYQPSMIIYALRALLTALSPLIGAELSHNNMAVAAGWADGVKEETIAQWKIRAIEEVKEEMERNAVETCSAEYGRLMRKRLALRRHDPTDESHLTRPLLDMMEEHKLDFHSTFRTLSFFRPSLLEPTSAKSFDKFITSLLILTPETNRTKATTDWSNWLGAYAKRILSEANEWSTDIDTEREKAAKGANPRFVLRQWVLEEVIQKVESDAQTGRRVLGKVLKMACNPFEAWGAEGDDGSDNLDAEIVEERRYCGMGDKAMLGFQCSCSS